MRISEPCFYFLDTLLVLKGIGVPNGNKEFVYKKSSWSVIHRPVGTESIAFRILNVSDRIVYSLCTKKRIMLSLLAVALAPATAIIIYVYLKDKHEKEPISLLIKCFLLGGVSVVITLVASTPIYKVFSFYPDRLLDQFLKAFFAVALIEESSKYVFVRYFALPNKHFNEPYDGIIYSVMVGMGFAAVENIVYVFQYGLTTGILRAFTAVPAHATFAILMGYFLGKAKFTPDKKRYYSFLGLSSALLFHGAYDFFLFIHFVPGIWCGAIASLLIGLYLSRKAMRIHQEASPFIKKQDIS